MSAPRGKRRPTQHRRVGELLRRQIADGKYPPGSRLPTEVELPKLLKAGKQTIVRALNDLVREGLIVRRRGDGTYVADQRQPPLIPGRNLRLGVLWHRSVFADRLLSYFQGAMTRGALAAWGLDYRASEWSRVGEREPTRAVWSAVERGVTVECLGESVHSRERHPDFQLVRDGRFDGLLSLSIIEEPWLNQVLDLNIPTVLVDFPNEALGARADLVYVDPLPGYRAAVKHFAAKGLTRIHFVGSIMEAAAPSAEMTPEEVRVFQIGKQRVDPDSYLRLSAYRHGMQECALQVREPWIHFGWHDAASARILFKALMALPESDRPQALICHSVDQAQYLMEVFAEHGMAVEAAGATEKLTTGAALGIHIDGKNLGETAAALLISRLQQPKRRMMRAGVPMRCELQQTTATA